MILVFPCGQVQFGEDVLFCPSSLSLKQIQVIQLYISDRLDSSGGASALHGAGGQDLDSRCFGGNCGSKQKCQHPLNHP